MKKISTPPAQISARSGFTVVELIVIIVVIGVLAAITIVSYRAITENANKKEVATAADTMKAALNKYKSEHGAFPSEANVGGVIDGAGLKSENVQYRIDSATGTYCFTASTDGASAYVNAGGRVMEGGCPGHGVNGEAAVVNLAKNPVANTTSGWTGYNAAGGSSFAIGPQQLDGDRSWRITAGSNGISAGASVGYEYQGLGIAVSPGDRVTPSVYVRASKAGTYRICVQYFNGTTQTGSYSSSNLAVSANTWTRIYGTEQVVASPTDRMNIRACYVSGTTWASGDWFEVTRISTAPGGYADGDSANWIWDGVPHASTSRGPSL